MFESLWKARALALTGVCATMLCASFNAAQAATALMIWPIDPIIESGNRATALWLENRDSKPVTLQTRVLGWTQTDGKDTYDADQKDVAISPPMVTVQPGERQLIRIIRLTDAVPGNEHPFRVYIDEIPRPPAQGNNSGAQVAMGVQFQMHYSLPLFVYGQGLMSKQELSRGAKSTQSAAPAPHESNLTWTIAQEANGRQLELINHGQTHVRITRLSFSTGDDRHDRDILGYVLPGAAMRWALPEGVNATADLQVSATVNGAANRLIKPQTVLH